MYCDSKQNFGPSLFKSNDYCKNSMDRSRTKILFLIPTLTSGGAERVIVNLLRHLDRSKFELILAVVNLDSAVFLDDLPVDVELIDLRCTRVRFAILKIIRLIWQMQPKVVFSTLGHLNLLLAMLRPLLPKNTRYLGRETTIVSEGLKTEPNPRCWIWAYKRFYGRFDRIICQSQHMLDDLNANFGISLDKLVVINNPVDIDCVRHLAADPIATGMLRDNTKGEDNNKAINLVSAGRLVGTKGFDLLIDALALCTNLRFYLTLLGEGPLLEELQAQAKAHGIDRQIRFAGFQKNPYAFIAQADAYVLSSHFEGFPNVVLEALACCTPVIATPALGGTKEILDGVEGCLMAKSVTAEGLAEALSEFVYGNRLSPDVIKPYAIDRIVNFYEQQFLI
jgi:glycosyltransferase involved in cell wall biosynthesis